MGVIFIDVFALNANTAVKIIPRNTRIKNYLIMPTTNVTVWIGTSENVTKTTGFPCTFSVPFPGTPNGIDASQEIWAIADSATPSVACYREHFT